MHNSIICVFLLLFNSYTFRHCRYPQGPYIKILLKHTAIHNLQYTYICLDVSSTVLLKLLYMRYILVYLYI